MKTRWPCIQFCLGFFLLGQAAYAGAPGFHLAASGMLLTSSSEQGGQSSSGSTVLSQEDLVYHFVAWNWIGIGAYTQLDKQGSNESDFAFGPKIELHWNVFYLEGGYAPIMERSFTDRSIAKQAGYGFYYGGGVRVPLSAGAVNGFFLQFSYKSRNQTVKKQDGVDLGERIIQKDGYPLFGVGYAL